MLLSKSTYQFISVQVKPERGELRFLNKKSLVGKGIESGVERKASGDDQLGIPMPARLIFG